MHERNCEICGTVATITRTLGAAKYGDPYTHLTACAGCGDVKSVER